MSQIWGDLSPSAGFMPHGHCYLWNPVLIWLHVISDSLIALAYYTIPILLVYIVMKRKQDIPFHWMFLLFGVFIIACGTTHIMEIWTLWVPHYWLAGLVKVVTALASVGTALLLIALVPKALAYPNPYVIELENMNKRLKQEAVEHEEVKNALKTRADELEQLNRIMVGRELKMAELKEKMAKMKPEAP